MDEVRKGCIERLKRVEELEKLHDAALFGDRDFDKADQIKQQLFNAQASAIIWLKALCKIDLNEGANS